MPERIALNVKIALGYSFISREIGARINAILLLTDFFVPHRILLH